MKDLFAVVLGALTFDISMAMLKMVDYISKLNRATEALVVLKNSLFIALSYNKGMNAD